MASKQALPSSITVSRLSLSVLFPMSVFRSSFIHMPSHPLICLEVDRVKNIIRTCGHWKLKVWGAKNDSISQGNFCVFPLQRLARMLLK